MVDISVYNAAKSDQLNAEDVTSPSVVRIETVKVGAVTDDQPVSIFFTPLSGALASFEKGFFNRRPWKPCKIVRRLLQRIYGADTEKWIGKCVRIYRDPTIRFGKEEVGGIRVSGAEGLEKEKMVFKVQSGRLKRSVIEIHRLSSSAATPQKTPIEVVDQMRKKGMTDEEIKIRLVARRESNPAFVDEAVSFLDGSESPADDQEPTFSGEDDF